MRRILVASDLSARSRRAIRRAVSLTRQFGCELIALHVVDDDLPEDIAAAEHRSAATAMHEHLVEAGAEDLVSAPVVAIRSGDPFKAIAEEADKVDADVVVMGAHRKRLLGDVFTGTTVERVMRLGSRPVLMVNRDDGDPYRRVLAAVDLSGASAFALRKARSIGLLDPAQAVAVHGFLPIGEGMMYYANADQSRIDDHIAASAAEARAAVTAFLVNNDADEMANRLLIEKGSPFDVVAGAAKRLETELLVIGTRAHSGLKRLLLGSVADEALRKLDCDVLAVPPQEGTVA